MKIRNKTNSPKEIRVNGQLVVVDSYDTIEIKKAIFDKRSFEIVRPVEKKKSSTSFSRKSSKSRRKRTWPSIHSEKEQHI